MPLTSNDAVAERYRIVRRLGSGGMATVFLAEDERLGRLVAIKRLHGESTEDIARRFRREARLGASLNHPNVVAIYDIANDDEGVLIVMEYVDGQTLREEIAGGPVAPERAVAILRGVAGALDHAHEHGVVHRDVKPANVLLRGDGHVKLADLGIASAAEQSRITKSGAVLGTASYMAPERLDGGPGDARVDVYALAAVAFEMLSGRRAIEGATPMEVARRVVTQPPPDLRDLCPDAPAPLAAALRRGLAKDPAERQASAGALVDEIAVALDRFAPEPPAAPRAGEGGRDERLRAFTRYSGYNRADVALRRRLLALVLVGLALIAAVLAIALNGGDDGGAERSGPSPAEEKRAPAERAPAESAPAPAAPSGSPAAAVDTFYTRAAAGDYAGAWALATPRARAQLGGFRSFSASQSTLESISFPKLKVASQTATSATVELNSRAVHADREDRCRGSVDLVGSGGEWRLDALHIAGCTQKRRK